MNKFCHSTFEAWCPEHGRGLCVYEWSGHEYLKRVHQQTCKTCGAKMKVIRRPCNKDGWTRSVVLAVWFDDFITNPLVVFIFMFVLVAGLRMLVKTYWFNP